MFKLKVICVLLLTALFLFGCNPVPTEEPRVPASIVGPVVPTGPSEVRDLDPTTEIVPNCGGGGAPIVKHPSMSVLTSHAVEWKVGGEAGIGVRVGDGPIPGGVDLSAALDTHLNGGFEGGVQQSTAWDLPAEPNTVMEYTLMWREVWQPGYIEVRLEDKSIKRVNVRYRAGIQSEIIGQQRLSCDGEQSIAPQPTTNFLTPTPVTPTDTPLLPTYTPTAVLVPPANTSSVNSAQATQMATCEWLKTNFPQSLEEVKARFNLPDSATNTFSLVTEICPGVANGFILRDAVTEFHLEVPPGGCIDSWSGETRYEGDVGAPAPDGFGGWRVYKGTVYTKGMTYRVANCELPK